MYEPRSINLINDLIRALPKLPQTRLLITRREQDRARAQQFIDMAPVNVRDRILLEVNDEPNTHYNGKPYFSVKSYLHDASKPLEGNTLLVPVAESRSEETFGGDPTNRNVLKSLERQGKIKVRQSPFRWEGGNVIVGDRHTMIGSDVVEAAMRDFKISRKEAIDALSKSSGLWE